jgi:hypothetical protein
MNAKQRPAALLILVMSLVISGCGQGKLFGPTLTPTPTPTQTPTITSTRTPTQTPTPGPLIIVSGGTYSGTWISEDPTVPAVQIQTSDPVTLVNCTIRSKTDLIQALVPDSKLTITNCKGYGLDPLVAGQARGAFLRSWEIGSLVAEHNYIEGTNDGFQLYNLDPDGVVWIPSGEIKIRYNIAINLDGALSDGKGGRIVTDQRFGQDNGNHFVILADLQNITGTEISWNFVQSDPKVSSFGDAINIYSSSGTPASPINIHDNYIRGGYPAVTNAINHYATGIVTDGRASDTAATATAFVKIYNNQVVAHAFAGISISAGHDNEVYSNRVVSTGQYDDGSWYVGYAGIFIMNCTCYNQPPTVFFNNWAHDNVVGFRFEWYTSVDIPGSFVSPPVRQDYALPDCAKNSETGTSKCTDNVSMPNPITTISETDEAAFWQAKIQAAGITIGPTQ